MRKNLTEIVFILDRSGSMSGLEADTIGGYNSLIKKQKNDYYGAVEPPVRCGVSHLSELTEPLLEIAI